MDEINERRCVECEAGMRPVRLIDEGGHYQHSDLRYAGIDAKRDWGKQYPIEGRVAAWLCGGCGRIALYADPVDEPSP